LFLQWRTLIVWQWLAEILSAKGGILSLDEELLALDAILLIQDCERGSYTRLVIMLWLTCSIYCSEACSNTVIMHHCDGTASSMRDSPVDVVDSAFTPCATHADTTREVVRSYTQRTAGFACFQEVEMQ